MRGGPSRNKDPDRETPQDEEYVVLVTRTHAKALLVPAVVLLVVAGVGGFLTAVAGGRAWVLWSVWVVALLVLVRFALVPFLRWFGTTYSLTSHRLVTRTGVLTRTGHDIPLNRINDISSERGPLDRLLGCGTLVISDASESGSVVLDDVPHVEDVQRSLSELLFFADSPGRAADDDGT